MAIPVLCDLDGVVWLAQRPIPGSAEAIAELRRRGHRVLFVTNNSFARIDEHVVALERIGIPAAGDLVSSATAAARLVEPGERVVVLGGPGIVEAVERRGALVLETDDAQRTPPDVVLVGFHRSFDYEGLRRAASAVRAGARLIGTNDDATYPTPDGPIPGGGAILAAVVTAAGQAATVAGKPHEPMVRVVREMLGDAWTPRTVMVGDRPDTDGRFARALGCRYAQVWSGVTAPGTPVEPAPELVADDLAGVVGLLR